MLNENAAFLSRKQLKEHVNKLNRNDLAWGRGLEPSLDVEWEISLLNAFSKVGTVRHEASFGGRRKPDLHFASEDDPNQFFIADITAVSDKGFDSHNPFDAFEAELTKRAAERGLRLNSFNIAVGGMRGRPYRDGPKNKLQLPPRSKFGEKIFNDKFKKFLDQIALSPNQPREFRVFNAEESINLAIGYNPHQPYSTSRYLSYRLITHLTENVVYDRLADKRDQLLESGFKGPLGIILCDGGFDSFNRAADSSSYSVGDVVRRFLSDNADINFVLAFSVERNETNLLLGVLDRGFFRAGHIELLKCIGRLTEVFPEIESDTVNAINHLKSRSPTHGNSHCGGFEVSGDRNHMRIKISSRAILELLAGRMSQQEFFERHRFIPSDFGSGPYINPFDLGLGRGLVIDGITFEKAEPEDDDWITFELSGPDPAVSPFALPSPNDSKS